MTNFDQVVELVMQYGIGRETAIEWAMSGPREPVAWLVDRDGHRKAYVNHGHAKRAIRSGGTITELYE